MSERVSRSISSANAKFVDSYAKKKGIDPKEALDKLLETAASRLAALDKWNKANPPKKGTKKTKAPKKAAKPAKGGKAKKAAAPKKVKTPAKKKSTSPKKPKAPKADTPVETPAAAEAAPAA